MKVEIYSDGSATTKQNAGGWGSVILIDGILNQELSGHLESATNNDAELIAAIKGLEYAQNYVSTIDNDRSSSEDEIVLISDSQIILNWANGTYKFKQLEKLHFYERLQSLVKSMNVKTKWVKGHSGDLWNDRCDKLANNARRGITLETRTDTRIGIKKTGIVCLWYLGRLKVIDLQNGIVEDYNRDAHGKRGSHIEIREESER